MSNIGAKQEKRTIEWLRNKLYHKVVKMGNPLTSLNWDDITRLHNARNTHDVTKKKLLSIYAKIEKDVVVFSSLLKVEGFNWNCDTNLVDCTNVVWQSNRHVS